MFIVSFSQNMYLFSSYRIERLLRYPYILYIVNIEVLLRSRFKVHFINVYLSML